ncbi:MAG: hypothetical protein KatS3mg115_1125 [Candidatus Poribacteria bacterium]|nr:MAG: hypothetical protein KatS3mg115_1125 [Candidatus Poribacteria bacterium]
MERTIGVVPRRRISRTALILSLVLHLSLAVIAAVILAMRAEVVELINAMDVSWMDMVAPPPRVIKPLKVPPQDRIRKEEPFAYQQPRALMRQARNDLTEVVQVRPRPVVQDVANVEALEEELLPDLTTVAQVPRDVQALSTPRRLPGETEGAGKPTGRTRVQGAGIGSRLLESEGPGGLLGGGGSRGVRDPLGIIDFLRGRGEQGTIVYVLDISASMSAAGLYKLELAKASLVDHLYLLSEEDRFNIVVFASDVSKMWPQAQPATEENIREAEAYLAQFTQESIRENLGTNTLGALEAALSQSPDVVVLLTDGLPTSAQGRVVETDPDRIIETVRRKNTNRAALYIVGLEIDQLGGPGELLLRELAAQTNGKVKFVGRDELIRYKNRMLQSP